MALIISAIAQGMLWSILSLGLFISFRILKIADMTTEGSYPLGAVVCVTAIQHQVHPILATLLAVVAGVLAGALTSFFITVCRIPSLLASILTMSALLSINLRIMGRPNANLLQQQTLFDSVNILGLPDIVNTMLVAGCMSILLISLGQLFFHTEIGQAIIATGDNEKMATAMGISTKTMLAVGLMVSNGIVALAGAVLAQQNGYADVNSGIGTIVIALAAIVIGEVVFGEVSFIVRLVCIIFGAIIYRLILVGVLSFRLIEANDFKLVTAIVIVAFLTMPQLLTTKKLRKKAE